MGREPKDGLSIYDMTPFKAELAHSEMIFAKRLRGLRKASGYTLENVEKDTGIRSYTISAYECGKVTPNMARLVVLAEYWGVSIDWLCGRDDFA